MYCVYSVLDTMQSILHVLFHLHFIEILVEKYYYPI